MAAATQNQALNALLFLYDVVLERKVGVVEGLQRVQLGLLPGGGGVVRTVRMLGIVDALMQLLLQGQRLRPEKAKEPKKKRRAELG